MHQPALVDEDQVLERVLQSPSDHGTVEMIVQRPNPGERVIVAEGVLSRERGLNGDRWQIASHKRLADGTSDARTQLTLINARLLKSLAMDQERQSLAGDQLVVDLDLSIANLPIGERLRIGSAVIEISDIPHNGCQKFRERFGDAALELVNSPRGKSLRLRGVYARVVEPGRIRQGDSIVKLRTGEGAPV
jgi:hypothetical protein